MDRLDNPYERLLATLSTTFPFLVIVSSFLLLDFFEIVDISVKSFYFHLWSSPVFLQELLRSRGSECIQIRTHRLRLLKPTKFFFGFPELVRLVLGLSCFITLFDSGSRDCEGSEDKSNPDVVGTGVRVSMYILFLVVFLSLFAGSFHSGPSGTKELGTAILISTSRLAETTNKVWSAGDSILIRYRSHIANDQPSESQIGGLDTDRYDHRLGHDRHALRCVVSDPFI